MRNDHLKCLNRHYCERAAGDLAWHKWTEEVVGVAIDPKTIDDADPVFLDTDLRRD